MTPLLAAAPVNYWPFGILLICLATIIVCITVFRIHAFLALIFAALLAGILTPKLPGEKTGPKDPGHWVQAMDLTVKGLGNTAATIGVVIVLASIIGTCLAESGAADKVVRRFLAFFGEQRAGHAIFSSGYVLSIPIFFDTFFMLLVPLARAMHARTGRDYMLYVCAICCGGTITHSLVAPHPGPLAMADNLHVDVGLTIVVGILLGLVPAVIIWCYAQWISRRVNAPMRELPGVSMHELRANVEKRDDELPSFFWSIMPVILPIILIAGASFLALPQFGGREGFPNLFPPLEFLGDRHIALLIGAAISVGLVMRQKKLSLAQTAELIGAPIATAGVIILITSAGGAFGFMLKNSGVGESIAALAEGRNVSLIFLGWFVSAVIRVAQGSATVAMLTTSSIVYSIVSAGPPLPYHPIYLFLAIGFGSKMLSWMNDSGFWTVSKFSGFTEVETLKSWSMIVSLASVVGLILTLTLAWLLPFKP
jgi:GntP family gluconate:H+ symporter